MIESKFTATSLINSLNSVQKNCKAQTTIIQWSWLPFINNTIHQSIEYEHWKISWNMSNSAAGTVVHPYHICVSEVTRPYDIQEVTFIAGIPTRDAVDTLETVINVTVYSKWITSFRYCSVVRLSNYTNVIDNLWFKFIQFTKITVMHLKQIIHRINNNPSQHTN